MTLISTNSVSKKVKFSNNGGMIHVAAIQDGNYWFTIGDYCTIGRAINAAKREMWKVGYYCNDTQLAQLANKVKMLALV